MQQSSGDSRHTGDHCGREVAQRSNQSSIDSLRQIADSRECLALRAVIEPSIRRREQVILASFQNGTFGAAIEKLNKHGVVRLPHLLGRPFCDDLPAVEHRHARGHAECTVHQMRDDYRCHFRSLGQVDDQLIDNRTDYRIQPRGRFIEKNQLRLHDQRSGETDAFAHATAQFERHRVAFAGELDQRQFLVYDLVDFSGTLVSQFPERQRQILADAAGTKERRVLVDHAHSGSNLLQFRRAHFRNLVLPEKNRSLRGFENSEEQAQDCSLAHAALSDDDEPFLLIGRERYAIEDRLFSKLEPDVPQLRYVWRNRLHRASPESTLANRNGGAPQPCRFRARRKDDVSPGFQRRS